MPKKKKRTGKHIPQRTCVGCHSVLSKRDLMRIVRTADGVRYDETGKAPGRGAYLHKNRSCWEKALKGSLAKALRTELTQADREMLILAMKEMPENQDG